MENNMTTLNTNGKPRKKYTTKKMIIKKNRKNGQKKAWDTRRALYPETNGYKPQQVEDAPKVQPKEEVKVDYDRDSNVEPAPKQEEGGDILADELAEKLANLDDFLSSVPGVEFNRDVFIREALTTAVDTVIEGVVVIVTGKEALTKKLKGMMEFVEEA